MLGTIIADVITSNFKKEQIKDDDIILFNEGDHPTNISLLNLGGYDAFGKCRLLGKLAYNTYKEWVNNLNEIEDNEFLLSTIFSSYVTDNLYEALSINALTDSKFKLNEDQGNAVIIVNDMIIKARKHLTKKQIKNALHSRELDDKKLYSLIEDGFNLFEKSTSFVDCIKKGLLEDKNRLSIILGATLEDAYNNDIETELIDEARKHLPSELGKIRPIYLYYELLNDALSSNTDSQVICEDTKYVILEENTLENKNYVETFHSTSLKSIKDYIIYYFVRGVLTPEYNDLVEDSFIGRDYDYALNVLVYDNYLNEDHANNIRRILRNIESHEDLALLNKDFDDLSEYLDCDYLKFKLTIFDDKKEALSKLIELIDEDIYDYKALFSTSFNVDRSK